MVAFEVPTKNAIPITAGGVEGIDHGINGETKIKEKILEQNKFKFPLNNLNLKDVDSRRERQVRRSSWLLREWTIGLRKPMHLGWVIIRVTQAHFQQAQLLLRQVIVPSNPKTNPAQFLWAQMLQKGIFCHAPLAYAQT